LCQWCLPPKVTSGSSWRYRPRPDHAGDYIAVCIGTPNGSPLRIPPEKQKWATIGLSVALYFSGRLVALAVVGCVVVTGGG
jgi:hypothetical protein